jgi:hypothetical protein
MRRAIRGSLAILLLGLAGCLPSHMVAVPLAERIDRPRPGMSVVHFLRSPMAESKFPRAMLFDDDSYIGRLRQGQQLVYETTPGRHLFMIVSRDVDFLDAELEPDKVYYVSVRRRLTHYRLTFSLEPHNDDRSVDDAKSRAADAEQVHPNAKGRRWGQEGRTAYERIQARWLPAWEAKQDKPVLLPGSGR